MKISLLNNNRTIIVLLVSILSLHYTNAQQRAISLQEAITSAKDKNRTILVAKEQLKSAEADYHKSLGVILPQLNVSHTALSTNDPLNAFGFTLQQQKITMANFDPSLLNNPDRTNTFLTKVELLQPLINVDGFYGRKAAKKGVDARASMAIYTEKQMALEVKKVYGQLQLMHQLVDVYKIAEKTILENKKVAHNFYTQGYLKKNDLLEIDIHVTDVQNQLQNAEKLVKDTSAYLSFLMGTDEMVTLVPSEKLKLHTLKIDLTNPFTTERGDLKAVTYGVEAQNNLYQSSKMKFLPRVNAFANYNWADEEFFGTNSNSYLLGVQLSWDIFKGFQNIGDVQKQKADLKIAELNADAYTNYSKMEIETAKRQLINAENSLELNLLAKDHAEEALKIRKNRFNQGLEKTTDLLNAETVFTQKHLAYLQAIFDYNLTVSKLQFLLNQ
jgi:outer membrane protein TolC